MGKLLTSAEIGSFKKHKHLFIRYQDISDLTEMIEISENLRYLYFNLQNECIVVKFNKSSFKNGEYFRKYLLEMLAISNFSNPREIKSVKYD